mmetsp:Transcript_112727/g.273731  ORF Transcript_112727/g.273731 Transcript_112727/m.273731 type:complete len:263 (-) Transcript_112727:43-831(-)
MDLGAFAEEVLDAVAGICGDVVVETHTQAAHVLDALVRRPGTDRRELAAVFGVSFEQLERCRSGGHEESKDAVYDNICRLDAVYTWNALIERINQAAHWREEFREMWNDDDEAASDEEELPADEASPSSPSPAEGGRAATELACEDPALGRPAAAEARERARALFAKHLDAPEPLRRRLVQRLDEEILERCPEDRDYRHCARGVGANLRRNTMLAAGYTAGRVPPQWIVACDVEALAPRMRQLQRRVMRRECLKEAVEEEEE